MNLSKWVSDIIVFELNHCFRFFLKLTVPCTFVCCTYLFDLLNYLSNYTKKFLFCQFIFGRGCPIWTALQRPKRHVLPLHHIPEIYRVHQWRTHTSSSYSAYDALFIYILTAANIYVACIQIYMHLNPLTMIKLQMAMVAAVGIEPTIFPVWTDCLSLLATPPYIKALINAGTRIWTWVYTICGIVLGYSLYYSGYPVSRKVAI